jgi:acetamidase/formamidase
MTKHLWLAGALIIGHASVAPGQRVHTIVPTPRNVVWGGYDPMAEPAIRVASGDIVDVTAVSTCNPASMLRNGVDSAHIEPYRLELNRARDSLRGRPDSLRVGPGGHILTGPIYVEGADSGDVIEVRFETIRPAIAYACNSFGPRSGFVPESFPNTSRTKIIPLDTVRMVGHFPTDSTHKRGMGSDDITIPLAPFWGSVGVAPPKDSGRINSAPPSLHAGNLDNRHLVAGTTLFIPVWVKGALLEVGDGHAGQGNGEVDITALETQLHGRMRLTVRKDLRFRWPRAETPTHYIAMGMDKDLTKATKIAVNEAINLIASIKGMSREDAYQLTSVACDVEVTQLVDGNVGVHVMIPKGIFR